MPGPQLAHAPPGLSSSGVQHLPLTSVLGGTAQAMDWQSPVTGSGFWPCGQQPPMTLFGSCPLGQQVLSILLSWAGGQDEGGGPHFPEMGSGLEPGGQH